MRLPLLAALALAACSSDPAPADSGPADTGALDSPVIDVGDDRNALPDFGPRDTGLDAGSDVGADVGFEAAAQEIPGPDVQDVPAPDVPADVATCGGDQHLCGGLCVGVDDLSHCGACGNACTTTLPHTRPACVERGGAQVCAWGCEPGWQNCDSSDTNGCEYDLRATDGGFCPH